MSERPARQRWSRADNWDIARCYFRATTTGRAGYIARLHTEWLLLRPDRVVSTQLLADRWRWICRNNIFSQTELDELREREVEAEGNRSQRHDDRAQHPDDRAQYPDDRAQHPDDRSQRRDGRPEQHDDRSQPQGAEDDTHIAANESNALSPGGTPPGLAAASVDAERLSAFLRRLLQLLLTLVLTQSSLR